MLHAGAAECSDLKCQSCGQHYVWSLQRNCIIRCDHRKPGTVRLSAAAYGSGRRTCHIRKSVLGKERDRAGKEDRCLGHAHRLFYCPCAVYPGQSFSNTAAGAFYNRPDDYRSRSFLSGDHPVYLLFLCGDADPACYTALCGNCRGCLRVFGNDLSVVMVGMSYQMPTNGGIIRGSGSIAYSMKVDLISTWGIVILCPCLWHLWSRHLRQWWYAA